MGLNVDRRINFEENDLKLDQSHPFLTDRNTDYHIQNQKNRNGNQMKSVQNLFSNVEQ